MVGSFFGVLSLGNTYTAIGIMIIISFLFNELLQLKRNEEREKPIPRFQLISWYFFAVTLFFLIPRFLPSETELKVFNDPALQVLHYYSPLTLFIAFVAGILMFTLSLEKGMYKYQFKTFAWTIVTLIFVVSQISSSIYNVYKGLFWLLFPASCVIVNDIFAYLFGFFLGKTPLIKLSPKKTWEGFIGGGFSTLVWGFFMSALLIKYEPMVCPQHEIHLIPFDFAKCEIDEVYLPTLELQLPLIGTYMAAPVQIHCFIISLFASTVAPFGGFFASGFKRAFKIKDFGQTIPGHGGLTDRFDCQIMMMMFTFIYLSRVVFPNPPNVDKMLSEFMRLSPEDKENFLEQISVLTET